MNRGGNGDTGQSGGHHGQRPEHKGRGLSREQLMDRIVELNPTATPAFLGSFSEHSLAHYLDHLYTASEPRGRSTPWVRRAESPGIMAREAQD